MKYEHKYMKYENKNIIMKIKKYNFVKKDPQGKSVHFPY